MIKALFIGSVSACFELENDSAYYSEKEYKVLLNGQEQFSAHTNVFSLFGLRPKTEYQLEVTGYDSFKFKTAAETYAVDVKAFGAKGDGVTDDTLSIQTAINCLPAGGRLYFPEGTYCTAPLTLKSHMTLELSEKAVLLGSIDTAKYPVIPGVVNDLVTGEEIHFGTWEGNAVPMHQALLFAEYAEDIKIVGRGTVDGNAQNSSWWQDVKNRDVPRPRLLFFNRCRLVTVHGITARNAASWQLHPYFSTGLSFLDLSVNAPKDSPNTDALDPEACDTVDIIGCRFSVGDDCIAIKSGKIEIGRKFRQPANRHTIRNCIMQFGHGAITLGSEMAGGVRNLTVNRCIFNHTDRGLRIKTRRGRGKDAVIDGVLFENIKMDGVLTPIVINMWYNCCDPDRYSEYNTTREALPVDDRTPYLGKFVFRDMECLNCHVAACYCDGLPEMPIEDITVENIKFTYDPDAEPGVPAMRNNAEEMCRAGLYFDNVRKLTIKNIEAVGCHGELIMAHNVGEMNKE
ncbi:glycoside hydrolase family 28 protein [Ruminococcus sp.]|uniref:glycoside hydrolase family 28 protein n=1 Tax=Ruminococcus sp. TaxID=41978 RepID=UPI0025D4256E|nr:glycoside hydrolase family 28 protein [Ruminococcus sp.]MBQ8967417.1 glycoside hydrolase family 28 protein [Ruminococcus sp.]